MKAFDIGWIPQGWEKGEVLVVRRLAGPHVTATIMQAPKPYVASAAQMNDTAIVTVQAGQESVAQAWTNWWKDT